MMKPALYAACGESRWESHRKTRAIEAGTAAGAARTAPRLSVIIGTSALTWRSRSAPFCSTLHALQHVSRHNEVGRHYYCPRTQREPPRFRRRSPAEDETSAISRVEWHHA